MAEMVHEAVALAGVGGRDGRSAPVVWIWKALRRMAELASRVVNPETESRRGSNDGEALDTAFLLPGVSLPLVVRRQSGRRGLAPQRNGDGWRARDSLLEERRPRGDALPADR